MAYLEPPWFTARVFNRIAMATGMSGSVVLAVTRRSGRGLQRVPVIPVEVGGTTYLVSTRGESEWVRNVRAHPAVTLITRGQSASYTASELPADQREQVLQAYRQKAGRAVAGYFRTLPGAGDHPVFALTNYTV
jgi:deazaflavin-dependent oxidoreductase (nitroreductase family)